MVDPTKTAVEWSDFDAGCHGFMFEEGVGIQVTSLENWLSWDEAVSLHRWLGIKIRESANAE